MSNIPDAMKKVVVDIETSFGERKKFITDLGEFEKERQKEAEKEAKERKKDLKFFVGTVHDYLNGVHEEMQEAHNIWSSLFKTSGNVKASKKMKKK